MIDISTLTGKVLRARPKKTRFPTKEDIYELAEENRLGIAYALEWYDLHKERGFRTIDGAEIRNWKGACTNWCRNREQKEN